MNYKNTAKLKKVIFKKSIICMLLFLFLKNTNAQEKYKLVFKVNENLNYHVLYKPMPENLNTGIIFPISKIKKDIMINASYACDNQTSLKVVYDLSIKDKSCCNPFTSVSFFFPFKNRIENSIKLSGEIISNLNDDRIMSCLLGFDIYKISADQDNNITNAVFPIYFPEKEISIGEKWRNTYKHVINNENKSLDIEYKLTSISNDLIFIEGIASDDFFIDVNFDSKRGCIVKLDIFKLNKDVKYLFKSYELLN